MMARTSVVRAGLNKYQLESNMKIEVDGQQIELKVGADPEVFVTQRSKLISAYGLVPGTKERPYPVQDGAIQVDGMALEFNINPANDVEEFVKNMNSVMAQLVSRLPADMQLSPLATAHFGADYIASQPLDARELGCTPDFSAYTGAANKKPNVNAPFRTAAGHVHIGWTEYAQTDNPDYMGLCCDFTKVLDLYLGVPSVLLDPDTERRSLYGQAGAFRPKTYGLEYRVLSNFWLQSEQTMRYVYKQTEEAIRQFLGGFRVDSPDVQKAINTSDRALASKLLEQYGVKMYA